MSRPRLLDLFCGAGGAAMGYHLAGFDVVGVDIAPQPHYPFEFHQADAKWFPLDGFDVIHASPPCQPFTAYRRRGGGVGDRYPDLIAWAWARLDQAGVPYVIENVEGAPLRDPVKLCGTGFALDVQRHRLFEASFPLLGVPCAHGRNAPRFPQATNRANKRRTVEVGVWRIPLPIQQAAMGIDWMTLEELSQAIPPAYTRFIGEQLLDAIVIQAAGS
ncbi:MAG TPA: DNA cytosine methyltransferase [Actinomycetes bacterium]|nr:DNA cytosine methyltransferase [Actinomycetes bacterium]